MDARKYTENLLIKRQRAIEGGVTKIKVPIKIGDFDGVEKEKYYLITALTKVGKTQFTSYLLYNMIEFAFNHKDKCEVNCKYFSLEESREQLYDRYASYLLYFLFEKRVSRTDLSSVNTPLEEEIINLTQTEEFIERFNFFVEHVLIEDSIFDSDTLKKRCEFRTRRQDTGGIVIDKRPKEVDENVYNIIIFDHYGIMKNGRMSPREAILDVSHYLKEIRNLYGTTIVSVQQQSTAVVTSTKFNNQPSLPDVNFLEECTTTKNDVNMCIGLYDPNVNELGAFEGYRIKDAYGEPGLGNHIRIAKILVNRDGSMGDTAPLYFDGACCHFEQLPSYDDIENINKYYLKAKNSNNESISSC